MTSDKRQPSDGIDPFDEPLAELRAIVARLTSRRRARIALWRWLAVASLAGIATLALGLPLAWALDEARAVIWSPHSE
jgi:ABC-type spermidine/putrescine transport system permease subunit I